MVNTSSYYVKQKAALPLGLLSIATVLKQNGHETIIFDRTVQGGSIKKQLKNFKPDIVGLSLPGSMSLKDALKLSKTIKNNNIPVVWGGPTASLIPELSLSSGVVDYVIIGDGEFNFLELIEAVEGKRDLKEIGSLAYLENGKAKINELKAPADLAEMPIIDFTFVNPERYFNKNRGCDRMLHVYASKGCTGVCSFCYNTGYDKRRWRPRPFEDVIEELRYLKENHGVDGVYFVDDLLSPTQAHLEKFCQALIDSDLGLYWSCDMRADQMTKEGIDLMYQAGCRWVMCGIESGTQEGQEQICKNLNLNKVREVLDYLDEVGIYSTVTFVLGFRHQTKEDLNETLDYMKSISAKSIIVGVYGPFPGSDMYRELVEKEIIEPFESFDDWSRNANMQTIGNNLSDIKPRELNVIINYFLFLILTAKHDLEGEKKHYWINRLAFQIKDMLARGNLRSLLLVLISAKEFLEILFYALAFPGIRKKYGLYLDPKKREKEKKRILKKYEAKPPRAEE